MFSAISLSPRGQVTDTLENTLALLPDIPYGISSHSIIYTLYLSCPVLYTVFSRSAFLLHSQTLSAWTVISSPCHDPQAQTSSIQPHAHLSILASSPHIGLGSWLPTIEVQELSCSFLILYPRHKTLKFKDNFCLSTIVNSTQPGT